MLGVKPMSTLLILYLASGLLLILISLPLLWGKVPPNPFYGFRVRATLENPAIWYPVNKQGAKGLLWTGVVVVAAALLLYEIPGLSLDAYALGCLAVLLLALTTALIQSFRCLRSIQRDLAKAGQGIRPCRADDLRKIFEIVNDAAQAYAGVIPADRWKQPYMPLEELEHEIAQGVQFSGIELNGVLVGVMGIQPVKDLTLIRHAYVATAHRSQGLGSILLEHLLDQVKGPILVGTWATATWAIRFYEKHGFRQVTPAEKDRLLRTYWRIPERQVETSVVLANAGAFRHFHHLASN